MDRYFEEQSHFGFYLTNSALAGKDTNSSSFIPSFSNEDYGRTFHCYTYRLETLQSKVADPSQKHSHPFSFALTTVFLTPRPYSITILKRQCQTPRAY